MPKTNEKSWRLCSNTNRAARDLLDDDDICEVPNSVAIGTIISKTLHKDDFDPTTTVHPYANGAVTKPSPSNCQVELADPDCGLSGRTSHKKGDLRTYARLGKSVPAGTALDLLVADVDQLNEPEIAYPELDGLVQPSGAVIVSGRKGDPKLDSWTSLFEEGHFKVVATCEEPGQYFLSSDKAATELERLRNLSYEAWAIEKAGKTARSRISEAQAKTCEIMVAAKAAASFVREQVGSLAYDQIPDAVLEVALGNYDELVEQRTENKRLSWRARAGASGNSLADWPGLSPQEEIDLKVAVRRDLIDKEKDRLKNIALFLDPARRSFQAVSSTFCPKLAADLEEPKAPEFNDLARALEATLEIKKITGRLESLRKELGLTIADYRTECSEKGREIRAACKNEARTTRLLVYKHSRQFGYLRNDRPIRFICDKSSDSFKDVKLRLSRVLEALPKRDMDSRPTFLPDLSDFPSLPAGLNEQPSISIDTKLRPRLDAATEVQLLADSELEDYNPSLQKSTSVRTAYLDRPVIEAKGYDKVSEGLKALGYRLDISEETINTIETRRELFEKCNTPNRKLESFETLAYYDNLEYEAQETLLEPDGTPVWIQGRRYHIQPGWASATERTSNNEFPEDARGVAVTEEVFTTYRYATWKIETECEPILISETENREEMEIRRSLRDDPDQTPIPYEQSDEGEAERLNDENLRRRVQLNCPAPSASDDPHRNSRVWVPALDEFVQVFPPPSQLPVALKYEEDISSLMKSAFKRFGPKHVASHERGVSLDVEEWQEIEARRAYEAERPRIKVATPEWDQLPYLHEDRSTEWKPRNLLDKARFYDQVEGRLERLHDYQLREAAIGAFKGSSINSSPMGAGKTIMAIIQAWLLGKKSVRNRIVYVVTLPRLHAVWQRECELLGIPVRHIKSIADARNLRKELHRRRKQRELPESIEIHLISSEWICLGGKSNMIADPWRYRGTLAYGYKKLFTVAARHLAGLDEGRSKLGILNSELKECLRDSNLEWVSRINGRPIEDEIAEALDKSWVVDLETVASHLRNRPHFEIDNEYFWDVTERRNAKEEAKNLELRTRSNLKKDLYRFDKAVKSCPSCRAPGPVWNRKTGHCSECGHTAFSYRASKEFKFPIPPLANPGLRLKSGEYAPSEAAALVKRLHSKPFHTSKGSKRFAPGYKHLPPCGTLIVDEYHNFVSFRTLHGRAIFDIKRRNCIPTSGTMCRNSIVELQPALALVHRPNSPEFPYSRNAMGEFRERFSTFEEVVTTKEQYGNDEKKVSRRMRPPLPEPSNTNALRRLIHGRIIGIDQPTLEQTWNLPPFTERLWSYLYGPAEEQEYRRELESLKNWQQAFQRVFETGTHDEIKEARRAYLRESRSKYEVLERLCNGVAKHNAAIDWLENEVPSDERCIIVCRSKSLYQAMKQRLIDEGVVFDALDDTIANDKRDAFLTRFAESDKRLLLTRVKLACEGFNMLVCCSRILFLQLDHTVAANRQMQKRLARIGQTLPTYSYFAIGQFQAIGDRSLDKVELSVFLRREKAIKQVIDKESRYKGPAATLDKLQEGENITEILNQVTNDLSEEAFEDFWNEIQEEKKTPQEPPAEPVVEAVVAPQPKPEERSSLQPSSVFRGQGAYLKGVGYIWNRPLRHDGFLYKRRIKDSPGQLSLDL